MTFNPQEHPVDLMAAAYCAAHRVLRSPLDEAVKNTLYARIFDGLDALMLGVKYEQLEDGWQFDSKPTMKKKDEERIGHRVVLDPTTRRYMCNCQAGIHGVVCWARGARIILDEFDAPTFIRTPKSDELFSE